MTRRVARCGGLAALSLLGSCGGGQNMFAPVGPGAKALASLGGAALIVFSLTTVVTWALLAFVALRRRGMLAAHAPHDAGGGERWIVIGGVLIPGLTFGVFFVLTLTSLDGFPLHEAEAHAPAVRVVGHQWWWEIHYLGQRPDQELITANELHIPVGQPVLIELTSRDVIHSFWVPRLHGKVDLIPGRVNYLRVQADRAGSFEGECAEFCGAQHAHMRLLVVAQSRRDYAAWIKQQMTEPLEPADPVAQRGRSLFETRACGLCHTVRGTQAHGTVGPDLSHLASRVRIGANSLPNNTAHLEAWAVRSQSLKPEVLMPNLTVLTGPELHALTHFLQSLE